jgi:hypothetical protein
VRYQLSRRDSHFGILGKGNQSRGTIGIFYTLLGRDRFGTGDWKRDGDQDGSRQSSALSSHN